MTYRAFTLVETLVAVALISIVIVGPFNIAQGVLLSSYIARDELIASALAQEGMEYVRQVRDSNYIYVNHQHVARSWLYGIDGQNGPDCYTNACTLDVAGPTFTSCGNTTCAGQVLYLDPATNLYNQRSVGNATGFTRTIRLTNISTTETKVVVTVSWNNRGLHTVTLVEYLRNWL